MFHFLKRIEQEKFNEKDFDLLNMGRCNECGLYKGCNHPGIGLWGEGKKRILVVGEVPGIEEDEVGRVFAGKSGRYLRKVLTGMGLDLDEDCWVLNAVRCRLPEGRVLSDKEIKACSELFWKDVKRVIKNGCKVVLLLGEVACKGWWGEGNIGKLRGRVVPDLERGVWVVAGYHPEAVLKMMNYDGYIEKLFKKDLAKVKECLRLEEVKDVRKKFRYEVIREGSRMRDLVEEIKRCGYCVMDFEMTGLRPYGKDKRAVCVGMWFGGKGYVIDCDRIVRKEVSEFLKEVCESGVRMVFHDAGVELEWLKVYFGVDINKVDFDDSLLLSYMLDEMEGTHGLKFLSWVEFGVKGYEEKVKKWLENIDKCPRELLWEYNAMDVFMSYLLWRLYKGEVERNDKFKWVYEKMLKKSLKVFVESSVRGCDIDEEYLSDLEREYKEKIKRLEIELKNIAGSYGVGNIDLKSAKQVSDLLYKRMELMVLKKTKTGMGATDEETLKELKEHDKTGFVEKLLEHRKYMKLLSTYIEGMREYVIGGKVHPRFFLHKTVTGRTSCSEPNVQNVPKREHKEVRNMFVVPEGYVFLANDYGQWEVRVVQMYARDKELGRAIWEGIDFHAEYTKVLTGLSEEDKEFKSARQDVKGGFTFASIYGAGIDTVTKSLWKRWLSRRFKKYEDAKEFVREVQRNFFERFSGLREWQERLRRDYERRGYIETLFGRRRRAQIAYTQLINTPVQSVASDFTLLSMVRAYEELGLLPVFMIHDDLTYVVREDEVEYIRKKIGRCMVDWEDVFEFVNVPIEVEQKIGKRWGELKDVGVVSSLDFKRQEVCGL